jgi:hypothetical protein
MDVKPDLSDFEGVLEQSYWWVHLGLSGKSEEKRPFWKCRLRWDDCIEIDKN